MTTAPHILVVTADPDPEFEYDYAIECPGVTDHCRAWAECKTAGCNVNREYSHDTVDALGHGQPHRHILGVWMVPTDHCHVQNHDGLLDAVTGRFALGRHSVDFDFNSPDDGDIQIIAI